jgi:hypothetical protein
VAFVGGDETIPIGEPRLLSLAALLPLIATAYPKLTTWARANMCCLWC